MNSLQKILTGSIAIGTSLLMASGAFAFFPPEVDYTHYNVFTPSGEHLGNWIVGTEAPGLPSAGVGASMPASYPREVDYTHYNVFTPSGEHLGNWIVQ